ncbi:hypothetical protein BD324DRAFT_638049 [Kockovaella imperatae]|uniref:Uncharacterized protein n=1 Tax=Kockovaella imperatae TaxID=4999 RepID=A0A1Y1U7L0_9TREE|nr:hypothetical protein BD324DRAFT_638049 [Kockovaella imperatae]ORX34020.1 hypothetical protein BD324DRAFT_638049 [Kockovaella imperatae]
MPMVSRTPSPVSPSIIKAPSPGTPSPALTPDPGSQTPRTSSDDFSAASRRTPPPVSSLPPPPPVRALANGFDVRKDYGRYINSNGHPAIIPCDHCKRHGPHACRFLLRSDQRSIGRARLRLCHKCTRDGKACKINGVRVIDMLEEDSDREFAAARPGPAQAPTIPAPNTIRLIQKSALPPVQHRLLLRPRSQAQQTSTSTAPREEAQNPSR